MKKLYTVTLASDSIFQISSAQYEVKPKTFVKIKGTSSDGLGWNYGLGVVKASQLNRITEYIYKQVITDDVDRITEFIALLRDDLLNRNADAITHLTNISKKLLVSSDEAILKAKKRIAELKENGGD